MTPNPGEASCAGIAMPAVLGALIVLALLASSIAHQAQNSYRIEVEHRRRESGEWTVQAGLNRAVKALTTPGDPMREALFSGHPAPWIFGGARISIEMSAESEKIDLNTAELGMATRGLSFALSWLSQEERAHVVARLADLKARRLIVLSPEILLPLDRRFSSSVNQLWRFTTTLSGQKYPSSPGHDPEAEEDPTERMIFASQFASNGVGASLRPIYRLTATTTTENLSGAVPLSASLVVVISANDPRTFRIAEGHL